MEVNDINMGSMINYEPKYWASKLKKLNFIFFF